MSVPQANFTVTRLTPCLEVELTCTTFSTELMACSMGRVTSCSMLSGPAPS